MGRYRLGDIIRMTRRSLSITQEQLSDGICSVESLSRMETGKQTPSRETYELLMERMGRIRDRAYSMLSISDFKVLEKMELFEDCLKRYDYQQADMILAEIKKSIGNTLLDKQFLIRAECLVDYRQNRIGVDEYLEGLIRAISLTIPKYGNIILSNWPLSFYEEVLLLNISTAYAEKNDYQKAIEILDQMNNAVKQSYMDEQQRAIMLIANSYNLAKWLGLVGEYERSNEIANEGIRLCRKYKLGNVLPLLLFCVAWNKEQLIEAGAMSPELRRECLAERKRAYYIAVAMQNNFIAKTIDENTLTEYQVSFEDDV